jgi:ABC-type branched-subunit amino acid transport system ATPase component
MRKEVVLSSLKLRSGYGGKPVLQGIDMDVREGEIVAVIGRNGVGKSTLMRTLIGLLSPTEGSIVFKGQDVSSLVAHRRARLGIGYVPQGRDVFPRMSVEENLKVGEMIGGKVPKTTAASTPRFRSSPNGAASKLEPCPAANSSNWRSAAS